MGEINWIAMIIATLVPMITGFVYYHKALFGNAWMKSIGMTEEKTKSANMVKVMGISLLMSFLMAFFMLNFCNEFGQEGAFDTFKHGAFHGVLISLVLIVPAFVINGLFEQKSWFYILINSGYWILTLAIMGGILDAMHHWPNVAPM